MFRRALIVILMAPLLVAAVANAALLPLIGLMISLLLIALAQFLARDEEQDE